MNLLHHLFNLMSFESLAYAVLIFLFISGSLLLLLMFSQRNKASGVVSLMLMLGIGNFLLSFGAIFSLTLSTMFLFNFLNNLSAFGKISSYLISSSLFIFISVLFAFLAYIVYLIDSNSYILQSDLSTIEAEKRKVIAAGLVQKSKPKLAQLKALKETILERTDPILMVSLQELKNAEMLKTLYRFRTSPGNIYIYELVGDELYYVFIKSPFIYGRLVHNCIVSSKYELVFHDLLLFDVPKFYMKLWGGKLQDIPNQHRNGGIESLKFSVERHIQLYEEIISNLNSEFPEKFLISLGLFSYFYLLQMVGMGGSFITPVSTSARLIHLSFGVYKFLFLGTFVTLLLQSLSGK